MPDQNLSKLLRRTMVEALKASAGTGIFKHTYVRNKTTGKETDTMEDGLYSCAFYVSGMLAIAGLIDRAHSTVTTTVAKMLEAGWYQVDGPQPGDVAHWPIGDEGHTHLGFYLGDGKFISNNADKRKPVIHGERLKDRRLPDTYYTHEALRRSV